MRSGSVAAMAPSLRFLSRGVSSVTRVMGIISSGRLPAVRVALGEDASGPSEAAGWQGQRQLGRGLLFQSLDQDVLHAVHVDEVDVQGPLTGGVQALGGVAVAQAQQLVSLPDLGPGVVALEEAFGEFAHRRPPAWRPHA